MHVCRCVYADVCAQETNFMLYFLLLLLFIYRYFTLSEVSPASGLVERPCNPSLRFHMHTHRQPTDLAEVSRW